MPPITASETRKLNHLTPLPSLLQEPPASVPTRLMEDIIRLIVDRVFDIGALDTSLGCTKPAERMSMAFAIESLGVTKRALCLVSRLLYKLCIRRFYEVVAVHDHRRLHPLSAFLRKPLTPDNDYSRGFYCRRLDIDIWMDSYKDWSHGATTLWGLIPACPRLEILNVNVVHEFEMLPWEWFLCPLSLLIQIADAYGPRLKRFELRGLVYVHFSGIRYLASKCPRLEILCVPRMFAVQSTYESDDLGDDLDQTEGRIVLIRETIEHATPLMSAEEEQIFALTHAAALDAARNAPARVDLPRLHTLEVGNYIDFTRHWEFPRLRVLHSSFLACAESYMMEHDQCLAMQEAAVARLGASLIAWTVALSEDMDPWARLRALPKLQYIGFVLDDYEEASDRPRVGHPALQEVDLLVPDLKYLAEPWAWLAFLHTLAAAGELPALRTVRVVSMYFPPDRVPKLAEWTGTFARLRVPVVLEFSPGCLRPQATVFHVPVIKDTHYPLPRDRMIAAKTVEDYTGQYPDLVRRLCGKSNRL